MANLTRSQLAICALGLVVVLVLGWRQLGAAAPADAGAAKGEGSKPVAVAVDQPAGGRVVVHVAGAVRDPGVYRLPADARVDDAVMRAGGPRGRADLSGLNLAAKLEDGRQVLVPERAAPGTPAAAGAAPVEGQPLSISQATPEQLEELSGVGPTTAQKIVDYREQQGGISTIEELDNIPGIGAARIATLLEEAVP